MTRAPVLAAMSLAALCLVAAGCQQQAAAPAEQGGEAAGEVLAGSVSDAMIPLETLESEAPLAPRQAVPVEGIDAEQPEVTPVPGIDTMGTGEGAAAEDPAPAEAPAQ